MNLPVVIQIVAYAVLVTAVIVTMRADSKTNKESLAAVQKWLTEHEKREDRKIDALASSVQECHKENGQEHRQIFERLGRIDGKIGNGRPRVNH